MKLWLGPEEMNAELALTFAQQEAGMMFRTNMEENAGMLFPLASTQRAAFWMKNCPLPLSVAYINPEGVIEEIRDMQPQDTNNIISASANIRFALETPRAGSPDIKSNPAPSCEPNTDHSWKRFFGDKDRTDNPKLQTPRTQDARQH